MDYFKAACGLLPQEMGCSFEQYKGAEEIRLRAGKRPSFLCGGKEAIFSDVAVTHRHLVQVIEKATGASVHTVIHEMRRGYIEYMGLRIGICGQAVLQDGRFTGYAFYSSLAIRIPHTIRDICPEIISEILENRCCSTLIIGAPGAGKTTVLRELIRSVSEAGIRIAVADERNELSGSYLGEVGFDLGKSADIMTGMGKAAAAMMLLRGMNPQVIAMDEITQPEDIAAVYEISGCGVSVFASAHGCNIEEMRSRKLYASVFNEGLFQNILTVTEQRGSRSYRLERI